MQVLGGKREEMHRFFCVIQMRNDTAHDCMNEWIEFGHVYSRLTFLLWYNG